MTEEQPYTVVRDYGPFELRAYPEYDLVQVTVAGDFMRAGNVAFGPLVSYISGNNLEGRKIAMTAPVLQESNTDESHTVSFVLPAGMNADDVPIPANSHLSHTHVAGHLAAAIKFGGGWNGDRFQQNGRALEQVVRDAGLAPIGNVYFARYDPPWKPWFLKRNEVLVAVEQPGTKAR